MQPSHIIPAANIVGESVLWNVQQQALWWTDIQGQRLHRYDWATQQLELFETPERIGSFGFVAGSTTRLIAAFASGLALYNPQDRELLWQARPDAGKPGLRFNDGRVDRAGRFWAGTMVEDADCSDRGSLYSLSGRGHARLQLHFSDVSIANGICFSPDGRLLYFADSPTHRIQVHALSEPAGTLGPARAFAHTSPQASPDGAAIDAEGYLWSAHWGGGCVVRYAPDGTVNRVIEVPASQPACVCFGGPHLDLLFVSTAREGLDPETLALQPHAGDVFVYRVGTRGLPEPEYHP